MDWKKKAKHPLRIEEKLRHSKINKKERRFLTVDGLYKKCKRASYRQK
jgi:hypothetical protein